VIKTFNVLDGHGIKMLQHAGIKTAIISARSSPIVSRRAADLGISHVHQGVGNKKTAFDTLLHDTSLTAEQCGFIGDDIIDLPILTKVVFAASVPNAHPEVASRVHYVSQLAGGKGAAREVCDLLLRSQGKYDALIAEHMAG
jgi:3-deoxy-D-manno-octulosonate 8-phosphate phosphatase (KDO 8-P phosphatase)